MQRPAQLRRIQRARGAQHGIGIDGGEGPHHGFPHGDAVQQRAGDILRAERSLGDAGGDGRRVKFGDGHSPSRPGSRSADSSVNSKRSPWKRTAPCSSGVPEAAK